MMRLRDLQKPRGGETNVNPATMDGTNRAEWLRREAELVARLRAEFDADPDLAAGETSSGGESWPTEDRRTGPRRVGIKKRLLVLLSTMVGQTVSSGELARTLGHAGPSGCVSRCLHDLAESFFLRKVGYGRWLVLAAIAESHAESKR